MGRLLIPSRPLVATYLSQLLSHDQAASSTNSVSSIVALRPSLPVLSLSTSEFLSEPCPAVHHTGCPRRFSEGSFAFTTSLKSFYCCNKSLNGVKATCNKLIANIILNGGGGGGEGGVNTCPLRTRVKKGCPFCPSSLIPQTFLLISANR